MQKSLDFGTESETCRVDKSILPNDSVFKGYRYVTIRDIVVKSWNTNYEIEIFYSPSEGKTYSGKLPDGVKGEFGPGLRTLILTLYHVANVSCLLYTSDAADDL